VAVKPETKVLAFDAWGTLLDDCGIHTEWIRREIAPRFGVDVEKFHAIWDSYAMSLKASGKFMYMEELMLAGLKEALSRFSIRLPEDEVKRLNESCLEHFVKLYEDVKPTLNALKGRYRLAILSDEDHWRLERILRRTGIKKFFEVVVTSSMVKAYKPSPLLFNELLRRMEVRPQEVLFVGDSPERDVLGAKRVGMKAVLLLRGKKEVDAPVKPDLTVNSLLELVSLLKRG